MGHFLLNLELKTYFLSFIEAASHISQAIADLITNDLQTHYGQLPVTCCVTYNGSNMVLATEKMKYNHIPYYLHTVQLIVKHSILKCSKMSIELYNNDNFEGEWWVQHLNYKSSIYYNKILNE